MKPKLKPPNYVWGVLYQDDGFLDCYPTRKEAREAADKTAPGVPTPTVHKYVLEPKDLLR